ncbi:hypothetical protein [Atlantibacter subterraneus]|uniref:hypothetical protein n=1 Tax=Atlantibacter subterraneus TaxID=255519 RepID=UPI00124C46C3|nr:hypothetical protein [Atlantibacter subterranea]QFH71537.1 hypothetical protein FR762_18260 [Enterobacter sp. E76]UTJ49478.1 hypothetical protein NLZ15_10875 [Atlantibacter subterranea]
MKINVSKALWGVAALLGAITGFLALEAHYQQTHFSCQNKITVFNQNGALVSDNAFEFEGQLGKYSATGKFSRRDRDEQTVNNTFGFYFWNVDKKLVIVANEESHHSPAYDRIPLFLPDVIFHRDMAIALTLIKINPEAYLFLRNDAPVFFCKKTG